MQTFINAPCSSVVEKHGFTTVYSNNQRKALKKQFEDKLSQLCFDQEEIYLLNQIQSETPKDLHGRPKREIHKSARCK